VFTHGGRKETEWTVFDWCRRAEELGAGEILLTSWDKDGTKSGFDCEQLAEITAAVNIPVIASGGGGTMQHFVDAAVIGHASAVLAASVFHFGQIDIMELKRYMDKAGVPVRLNV
jgi:cyclase